MNSRGKSLHIDSKAHDDPTHDDPMDLDLAH